MFFINPLAYPLVYNYLIITFLISIIFNNWKTKEKRIYFLKTFISIFLITSIPAYTGYKVALQGYYLKPDLFVVEFIIGILIFYLIRRFEFLIFIKYKSIRIAVCISTIMYLINQINNLIEYFMQIP